MSESMVLKVEKREKKGRHLKSLRREGIVPLVVSEKGKESTIWQAEYLEVKKLWEKAGKHHLIELKGTDFAKNALLKDIDFHPGKNTIEHVSFQAVRANAKIETEVPIEITGEIPAVRNGYFLVKPDDTILIEVAANKIPEKLEISGESLVEPGDMLKCSDLVLPKGVELKDDPEKVMVLVEAPQIEGDKPNADSNPEAPEASSEAIATEE